MRSSKTSRLYRLAATLFLALVSVCLAALLIPANTYAQAFGNATGTNTFPRNLSLWQKGDDVRALQRYLNTTGFFIALTDAGSPGKETALFGLRTYRALIRFQAAHKLPATGFFGPLTRMAVSAFAPAASSAAPQPTRSAQTNSTPSATSISPGYGGGSTAVSGGGGSGGSTSPSPAESMPPSIPGALVASAASPNAINLTWSASTDNTAVTGYRVYRDGTHVATTTLAAYNDTGLSASTLHSYWVDAFDAAGNVSTTSIATSAQTDYGADAYGTTWKPIRIGAGGAVVGMDMTSDGTRVIRTDTYGGYIWDGTEWRQLVTSNSMPAEHVTVGGTGIYEIRIAPSNTKRMYMQFNGYTYRSDNRGSTWVTTALGRITDGSNDNYRASAHKMAVDPINPDVVISGTPNEGVWITEDAGANWSRITALGTTTTSSAGFMVSFDPTSAVVNGKTQGIYVARYGTGVYHSTNGGATWTLTTGGVATSYHMIVDQAGTVWVTPDAAPDYFGVYTYKNGVWSSSTLGYGQVGYAVAVNPSNANHVIVLTASGLMFTSTNGGTNWTLVNIGTFISNDIPWLAWSQNANAYLSAADIQFDKTDTNKLYFPAGLGFWYTTVSSIGATVNYTSQSRGIEQMASINVIAPLGGKPILSSWDRPGYYVANPDEFPSTYIITGSPDALTMGWDFDYASNDPSYIAGIMNYNQPNDRSGYSTDGGLTWTAFATKPAGLPGSNKIGGSIAVASSTSIVWIPSNTSQPYYTTNGGATWTGVIPSGTTAFDAGWGWAHYINRHIVTADRVNIGTYYAYNNVTGLFRSVDGGANWTLVYSGAIPGDHGFNTKLKAVPGRAGELFLAGGPQGSYEPPSGVFSHSFDGGSTWSAVPNVKEVLNFGFGKAAPGTTTPSIYIAAWLNDVYGIYQSDDNAVTWKQVGKWPTGILTGIHGISGDMNIYGRVYAAVAGIGWVYGDTADIIFPPVLSNISSGVPTTTSATITWTTDKSSNSKVIYGATTAYASSTINAPLTTSHSVTLTDLTPASLYHFKVVSTDSAGDTSTSSDQTFTTYNPSPPTAPGSFAATAISESEIDLSWTASTDLYSTITYYNIYRDGTRIATTSLLAYSDTSLLSSTLYSYDVTASDALNLTSASSSASTTTLSYTGPQDINGQAYALWSTRCASNAYSGNVADVWDAATGNTTHTLITCTAGNLNETINPLSTTCASGCSVATLYDQSESNSCGGAPCDVVQPTLAMRPGFTPSCANGKSCLHFNPVYADNQCLISPNTTVGLSQPFSSSGVWNNLSGYNYSSMWQWGAYPNYLTIGTLGTDTGYMSSFATGPTVSFTQNALHASQLLFSTTTSSWLVDSTPNGPLTVGTTDIGTGFPFSFGDGTNGANCAGNASWGTGKFFEFGLWFGDKGSNNATMNANQHSYWGF